ncbi:PaaI family thioesterase [Cypionkella sp. TWP1-2-1b2]|uniref:PaaI family thioesterase n=1 Tax=Cypionkella sp. TWP1-2-1b2 TaxID=2804675 RepID=UPI003CF6D162
MTTHHPLLGVQPPFADHLGLRILSAQPDRIEAEMLASPQLINRNGTLHGGAVMGMADHLGGLGAFMNIGPTESTATVESKTNFFRAIPAGDLLHGVAVLLHGGRQTMVWQTTLTRSDGKMAAMVTQTQIVLRDPKF